MPNSNLRRCVVVCGRKTSVSLEDRFWEGLKAIAAAQGRTLSHLVSEVAQQETPRNLSSALRIFVLNNLWALIMTDNAEFRRDPWTPLPANAAPNGLSISSLPALNGQGGTEASNS